MTNNSVCHFYSHRIIFCQFNSYKFIGNIGFEMGEISNYAFRCQIPPELVALLSTKNIELGED